VSCGPAPAQAFSIIAFPAFLLWLRPCEIPSRTPPSLGLLLDGLPNR